jgi:Holliday junction resolvase-like predicted endonuclease
VINDSPTELTLLDKLSLYPEIMLDETLNKSRSRLKDLLKKVDKPNPDDNIGLLLEEFARIFLESPYLKFNKDRRRCETGEIDLDFTVKRFQATLFYEFSILLIVECKNWKEKAGAPELRVFCSKMRNVSSKVGILFSRKGLTKDAKGIIRDAWLQDKIIVITFDYKDLDLIINGSDNVYTILNRKYLAVITASRE